MKFLNKIRQETWLERISVFIATWFYSGLIPPPKFMKGMAGTYGSFFSLPLCILATWVTQPGQYIGPLDLRYGYTGITVTIFLVGLWSVHYATQALGRQYDWRGNWRDHDQNQIVIDETLGMLVACWPTPLTETTAPWIVYTLGFGLFRLFDIVKPFPIKRMDSIATAEAVMLDDTIAGVYALITLNIILALFK